MFSNVVLNHPTTRLASRKYKLCRRVQASWDGDLRHASAGSDTLVRQHVASLPPALTMAGFMQQSEWLILAQEPWVADPDAGPSGLPRDSMGVRSRCTDYIACLSRAMCAGRDVARWSCMAFGSSSVEVSGEWLARHGWDAAPSRRVPSL